MSEEKVMEVTDEISFAEELEKSLVSLKTGDIVKGVVIGITPTEVYVDLGSKADGIIPVGELTEDPSVSPEDIVKVGDEIDVFVVRVNDVEGTIKLSKKKLDIIAGQKKFETAVETKEILEGGFNTGYGTINRPKRIESAAELSCILLQSSQNDMFGGQSHVNFDNDLAPYVEATRQEIIEDYKED